MRSYWNMSVQLCFEAHNEIKVDDFRLAALLGKDCAICNFFNNNIVVAPVIEAN